MQKEGRIEEFNALLQASFVYHMKDLKFVSRNVVVPTKNDIDFEPLNDSTNQDQFSLPFRDEILDEISNIQGKVMWRMWCAEKEFMLVNQRSK